MFRNIVKSVYDRFWRLPRIDREYKSLSVVGGISNHLFDESLGR